MKRNKIVLFTSLGIIVLGAASYWLYKYYNNTPAATTTVVANVAQQLQQGKELFLRHDSVQAEQLLVTSCGGNFEAAKMLTDHDPKFLHLLEQAAQSKEQKTIVQLYKTILNQQSNQEMVIQQLNDAIAAFPSSFNLRMMRISCHASLKNVEQGIGFVIFILV